MQAAELLSTARTIPERHSVQARSCTRIFVVGLDLTVVGLSIVLARYFFRSGTHAALAAVTLLGSWLFWLDRGHLYSFRFITRRSEEIRRVVDAGLKALGTTVLFAYMFRWDLSRPWLIGAATLSMVGVLVEREVLRRVYNRRRREGSMQREVLIVGSNDEADELDEMFASDTNLGYNVLGTVPASLDSERRELVDSVFAQLEETGATGVVVAATSLPSGHMNRLVRDLLEAGIHVELTSTLADIEPHRLTVRPLGRYPVVYVEPINRMGWRNIAKRSFDIFVSLSVLAVFAPVMAVVAALIKRDSEGPVLFKQERVGKDGVPFEVLKFRTMGVDAEARKADLMHVNEGSGPLFKMKVDPRVTRIGKHLRAYSLDELPQLWNVVRGEMSLVGPRPALASETSAWEDTSYGRLRVRPGITGVWQVSGRSETTFEEYIRLDLYYVDNWSLIVDLSILIRTLPAVIKSRGAY